MTEFTLPILILGACIGSFLNVISLRLPRNKSFLKGRSKCPSCGKILEIRDLFPIFSWIFLKAKCRNCNEQISIRYPLVEICTSILFIFCMYSIGFNHPYEESLFVIISGWTLISLLMILTVIDLDEMILPNSITSIGTFLGLFLTLLYDLFINNSFPKIFTEHIIAYLIALFSMYLFGEIVRIIFGRPAFGNGDAKLFAMSGAWLGITGLEVTIVLSFLFAGFFSIIGLVTRLIRRGEYIPFGPFISIATFLVWMLGSNFWINSLGNIFWWRYL